MEVNRKLKFNYNPEILVIYPDKSFALLDKYRYDLLTPPLVKDGVLYLGLPDLSRIFSPDRTLPENDSSGFSDNGICYVPAVPFLSENLQLKCTVSQNRYIFSKNGVSAGRFDNLWWDLWGRDKDWGDLSRVFWFGPLKRLLPYRLYIPTWYDGSQKMKLLCLLHGGGSTVDEPFENTGNRLQLYAEKYGYKFEPLGKYEPNITTQSSVTTTSSQTTTTIPTTLTITSSTSTSATTSLTTTIITTTTQPINKISLGDVNNDNQIDAVDASSVLSYYAMISTNQDGGYDDKQKAAADVNHDGQINAVDASCILSYYAYVSTTKDGILPLEAFLKKK